MWHVQFIWLLFLFFLFIYKTWSYCPYCVVFISLEDVLSVIVMPSTAAVFDAPSSSVCSWKVLHSGQNPTIFYFSGVPRSPLLASCVLIPSLWHRSRLRTPRIKAAAFEYSHITAVVVPILSHVWVCFPLYMIIYEAIISTEHPPNYSLFLLQRFGSIHHLLETNQWQRSSDLQAAELRWDGWAKKSCIVKAVFKTRGTFARLYSSHRYRVTQSIRLDFTSGKLAVTSLKELHRAGLSDGTRSERAGGLMWDQREINTTKWWLLSKQSICYRIFCPKYSVLHRCIHADHHICIWCFGSWTASVLKVLIQSRHIWSHEIFNPSCQRLSK